MDIGTYANFKNAGLLCNIYSLGFRPERQQGFDGHGERDPVGAGGRGGDGAAPVQRPPAARLGGRQE